MNTIPEKFIFNCELFKEIERTALSAYGRSDPGMLVIVICRKISVEKNVILTDLYRQILSRLISVSKAVYSQPSTLATEN